jgi:carbon storage regulator
MLVLKRRAGESLMIDGGIEVMVLGVQGGQVKIGINAPTNIKIYRDELYERMTSAVRKLAESGAETELDEQES